MTLFVGAGGVNAKLDAHDLKRYLEMGLEEAAIIGHDLSHMAVISVDKTRIEGRSGELVNKLYSEDSKRVGNIFLALGSHQAHTRRENWEMFGEIPPGLFVDHNWEQGVVEVGKMSRGFLEKQCGVCLEFLPEEISFGLNQQFVEGLRGGKYGTAISFGPVFPHEVVGFSNGNKNRWVGIGKKDFIDASHLMMAMYGMEKTMGRLETPMRQVMNYADVSFIRDIPIIDVLTVLGPDEDGVPVVRGFYMGIGQEVHAAAAKLSGELNVHKLDNPLEKVVVYLDPSEYHSTWLGMKAVYRTRMAIADGGTLIVVAPGLRSFDDDPAKNPVREELIASVGYRGTDYVTEQLDENDALRANPSIAAHLIHGSSENRFDVIYLTDPGKMPLERMGAAGVKCEDVSPYLAKFDFATMRQGMQNIPGIGEVYGVPNPALTLLTTKEKFEGR